MEWSKALNACIVPLRSICIPKFSLCLKGFGRIISCVSRVVSTDFSSWHSTKAAWSQISPSLHTQVVYFEISSKFLQCSLSEKFVDCKFATFILLTWLLESCSPGNNSILRIVILLSLYLLRRHPLPSPFHTDRRITIAGQCRTYPWPAVPDWP